SVDLTDPAAVEAFKAKHYLNDEDLTALQAIKLPPERKIQDYRSTYNDVRDWLRRQKAGDEKDKSTIDWEDRKSTRLNSSHVKISYAVFCLKKKRKTKK